VVGGRFSLTATLPGATTPQTFNHLVRLNANGSLDVNYNPNPNSLVLALVSQLNASNYTGNPRTPTGDGKIVVAGGFTSLYPPYAPVATFRNRIARINPDGTTDSEFDPNANNAVATLAVQRDWNLEHAARQVLEAYDAMGGTDPEGKLAVEIGYMIDLAGAADFAVESFGITDVIGEDSEFVLWWFKCIIFRK
jgi:hypothetical protein